VALGPPPYISGAERIEVAVTQHRAAALALAVVIAISCGTTTGCGVSLKAPRLVVDVVADGIILNIVSRGERIPAGETVVDVRNQSDREVRILLLKDAPPVDQLPDDVLSAVSPLDSSYVVAASNPVKRRKNELAAGGIGYRIYSTSFHVHFARDHEYSLVAVDGTRADALVVRAGAQP
jgi:hypothetical protein